MSASNAAIPQSSRRLVVVVQIAPQRPVMIAAVPLPYIDTVPQKRRVAPPVSVRGPASPVALQSVLHTRI